jgi:hypothetical protein
MVQQLLKCQDDGHFYHFAKKVAQARWLLPVATPSLLRGYGSPGLRLTRSSP